MRPVGARPKCDADAALERDGQHGQAVIIDVFADQVDAARSRRPRQLSRVIAFTITFIHESCVAYRC